MNNQGIPFDMDKILRMFQEHMKNLGVDISMEEIQEAFQKFIEEGGKFPNFGMFTARVVTGPDGVPKLSFGGEPISMNPDITPPEQEPFIYPEIEIYGGKDETTLFIELPGAVEDTIDVRVENGIFKLFALSPVGEFQRTIPCHPHLQGREKIKSIKYRNNVLEVKMT